MRFIPSVHTSFAGYCNRKAPSVVALPFDASSPFSSSSSESEALLQQGISKRLCAQILLLILLLAAIPNQPLLAQDWMLWANPRAVDILKNSPRMLSAFRPVAAATAGSIVIIDADGEMASYGTVVSPDGLLITKASEVSKGKLTCVLQTGEEVQARILATDDRTDLALLRIDAKGLKPISWTTNAIAVGQWVVTPGSGETAAAVGIVSVPPRKILPRRALIGVVLEPGDSTARVQELMPGFGAEKAGIKPGDFVLSVDGKPVKNRDELMATLRQLREGRTVNLHIRREEEEFDVPVEMKAEASLFAARSGYDARGFSREDRMNRMGSDISDRAEDFELAIQHDTVLEPWQCGGPLVDLDGRAVGLNIARAGRVATYALPAEVVQRVLHELKSRSLP